MCSRDGMGARNGLVLMRRNIIIINEEWEAQEETKERKLGESDLFLFLLLFKGGSAKLVSCVDRVDAGNALPEFVQIC